MAPVSDRKLNTVVQISVIHPVEQTLTRYSSTEIVEGTKDPLFLTGVTFPPDYPIYEETRIKLTVYDVKDKSHDTNDHKSRTKEHDALADRLEARDWRSGFFCPSSN